MTDQDRIALLLARQIAGELTPPETEELRLALEQDPNAKELLASIEGVSASTPLGMSEKEERQLMEKGLRQFRRRAAGVHAVGKPSRATEVRATEVRATEVRATEVRATDSEVPEGVSREVPAGVLREAPAGVLGEVPVGVLHEAPTGILRRMPGRARRGKIYRWSAAAAIILLAGAGAGMYVSKTKEQHGQAPVNYKELVAKYGTRSYLELPDGSKLWLNAGSKVRYADGFAAGARELTLEGEAFFDVKHDPGHPFLIHTGGLDVKVLGTSLNVKAYPGDSLIETTLIQGRAEIELPGNSHPPIVLRPNEKVTMRSGTPAGNGTQPDHGATATGATAGVTHPDHGAATAGETPLTFTRHTVAADATYKTIIETSWVEDKLVFRNKPFREVAAQLERWYNIRFHFANGHYLDDKLTGYFKDQPLKNVMDGLQLSLGFHSEIAGDSILIK